MAWYDDEDEFFRKLKSTKLELKHNSGYFTVLDKLTNINVGTYGAVSHEYNIRKPAWGSTGYVLHTHQTGSFVSSAHIKESSYGNVTLTITRLQELDSYLPSA